MSTVGGSTLAQAGKRSVQRGAKLQRVGFVAKVGGEPAIAASLCPDSPPFSVELRSPRV